MLQTINAFFFATLLLANFATCITLADDDGNLRSKAVAILKQNCFSCHGAEVAESGLRLDSAEAIRRGGDSGAPLLAYGSKGAGELLRRVLSTDLDERMPPEGQGLPQDQRETLKEWIAKGATWPDKLTDEVSWPDDRLGHWAWQPLAKTLEVENPAGDSENLIDVFLARQLNQPNDSIFKIAPKKILIRRIYFDLIGLPPSPEAVDRFVSNEAPGAYEQLVDELLASTHYGERWARHWLDLAHYADTHGYDKDQPRPNAWPYRDYVIRAINEDKPYSRFIEEQVAGDALFPDSRDGVEALGFLAAGPWDFIGHVEVPESKTDGRIARHLDRDDMLGTVLGTFCSVTVQCAQCHDHKFDPISQKEYYELQSVFAAVDRADRKYFRDLEIGERVLHLTQRLNSISAMAKELQSVEFWAGPNSIALLQDAGLLVQRAVIDGELARLPKADHVYVASVYTGGGNFVGTGGNGGKPRPIFVLARGNVSTPGERVSPRGLQAIKSVSPDFACAEDAPESQGRVALARWISAPDNPLTWRSIVNRIWQQHFGVGIVETANDFGRMGATPTNRELLDWLALDFRDHGGSLKRLHKQIVMSRAYRSEGGVIQTRKKLDAEAIRDAILSVSGQLDLTQGGPGFQDFVVEHPEHSPHYEYQLYDPHDHKNFRRSIYRFVVRSQTQPMMTALDCADPSVRVAKRNETNTALQALTLLNDGFMLVQCEHFSARVRREAGENLEAQIRRAVRLALARDPQPDELVRMSAFVHENSLEALARVLFNSNEFVFVD